MKKRILSLVLTLAMVLSLFAGLTITASAADAAFYTLTPANGGNNNYTSNCDITVGGITWNLEGNSQLNGVWGIGGKSGNTSNANRALYTKTAMGSAISKVDLKVGDASGITVNSLKLIVASDSSYATVLDTVTASFAANSTITFTPTSGSAWATGAYYKFQFNVTSNYSSNKKVSITGADFYAGSVTPPASSDASEASEATEATEPTPPPAGGTYYEKVTAIEDGNYLIVFEDAGKAFDGTDVAHNYKEVTIADGKIADANGAAIVEIAAMTGGYSLKILNGDKAGSYIYGQSNSNKIIYGTDAVASTITFTDGAATIANNSTYFCFNKTAGDTNDRFRFYKSTTTGASYIVPALYREVEATSCEHANKETRAEVPATCTTPGTAAGTYCLDCGKYISGGDAIAALGHDYAVVHTTAPTCTEAGLDTYTCSRCSDSYTKPVAALGHNYVEGICVNLINGEPCGAEEPAADVFGLKDTLEDGDEVILYNLANAVAVKNDNLGGDWYLGTTAVAPVNGTISTYDTSIVWTVSIANGKYTFTNGDNKIVAWLSGNYVEITNDPTHSGADAAWTISDASIDDHTHLLGTAVKSNAYAEVYTKPVNQVSQLVVCGYTSSAAASDANFGFQFYVKGAEVAHDHVWDEGTETTAATCTTAGVMTYACTVDGCEETYTEAIPALGHIDENSDNVCDRCEIALETYEVWTSVPEVGYDYIIVAEADGKYYALDNKENGAGQVLTCTEVFPVNDAILCTGDYVFTAVTAEDGANPKNEGIAFLQLGSDSLYLHLNSGKIRVASGTANAVMSIAESADVDEAFTITAMQSSKALSFNGSKFVSGDTASAVYFYAKESAHVHAYGEGVVTTAPTCVAEGVMTYTCECGDSYTEAIPATGEHDYVEGICSVCGAEEPAAATYALVTDLSQLSDGCAIVFGSAANNAVNGALYSTNKYLTVATEGTIADGYATGSDVVEITLTAVGGGWTLSVDGTAIKASGDDVALCGEGDAATVWAISVDAATGAATISVPGTDPLNRFLFNKTSPRFKTYTSAASASMILPEIYVKGGTIVACEHENTEVRDDVAATCTTAGYTGDTYCLDCGKLVERGTTIAALGHNYVEGVCDRCGATEPVAGEYAGLYYIAANGYYATNDLGTASTKRLQGEAAPETLPESVTIAAADNKTFEIVSVADGYVLKASAIDGDNYVGYVDKGVGAFVALEDAKVFAISEGENGIHFTMRVENEDVDRYLAINTSYAYFGWYKDSNSVKVDLALIPVTIDEDAHTHAYAWNNEIGVDGSHTLVCECGETKTEACADAEPVVTPATCIAYSSTAYTCDVCGATWTVEGTTYAVHNYEDGVCTVCGEALPAGYTLVTDAADLADGDVFVFGATKDGTTYGSAGINGKYLDAVEATLTDDALSGDGLVEITLIAVDGGWNLKIGDKFINATAAKALTFADEASTVWTISIDENNLATVSAGETAGRFLYNVGSPRFLNYTTATTASMLLPSLYKAAGDTPDVPPVEHEHNIYHYEGVAATCSAEGYAEYYTCNDPTCECYHKMYSDEALTAEFTEITIPALPHTFVTPTAEDADHYIAATCTEDGLYYEYCSVCGAEGASHEITALGHDMVWDGNVGEEGYHGVACSRCDATNLVECTMVDGTCSICGYSEGPAAPIYKEGLSVMRSLSLGADLSVYFTIRKTVITNAVGTADDVYFIVTKTNANNEVSTVVYGDNATDENGRVAFGGTSNRSAVYSGVWANEMGDVISATLYVVSDGITYYGPTDTFTIKDYLYSKVRETKTDAVSVAGKTLAVDMLKYGAAAQVLFNYDVDNLVDSELTADELLLGTQGLPSVSQEIEISSTGSRTLTSVSVQNKVMLYLNYTGAGGPYEHLKVRITDKDTGDLITNLDPTAGATTGRYSAIYDNVGARQMRQKIEFTLVNYTDSTLTEYSAISTTVTWSIESYVNSKLNDSKSTQADIDFANAMLVYGDSVGAFMTASGQ